MKASRSGDHDVSSLLEGGNLCPVANSTMQERDIEAGVFAIVLKLLGDLVGEFARWLEHEALRFAHEFELAESGESEGCGLSGSRLRGPDDIAIFQNQRNALLLNWGWISITGLCNGLKDLLGEPKLRKRHGVR